MGKDHHKFECAYVEGIGSLVYLAEIQEAYTGDLQRFNSEFKGKMLCHECRIARLTAAENKSFYLKTHNNDSHSEWCSMQIKPLTPKEVDSYYHNTKNNGVIERRLKSVIRNLMLPQKLDEANPFICESVVPPKRQVGEMSGGIRRSFPQKILRQPLTERDCESIKIFYGIIKLQRQVKPGAFKVYEADSGKYICYMWFNKYALPLWDTYTDGIYYMALLEKMTIDKKEGRNFFSIRVHSPYHIQLKSL